jgi:DNA-binding LytR/AlgR family response regulator
VGLRCCRKLSRCKHLPMDGPRPTLLIAEPEPAQALSVRKLVLETAKFNVLTAHSTREAIDLFHLFPNISAAVLVEDDGMCSEVANHIRTATSKIPIVFLTGRIAGRCEHADYNIPTGEPERLLSLVRSLLGDPREIDTADQGQVPARRRA